MVAVVIADASPLIALARLNGLEWLQTNGMPRLCRTAPMVEQVH